MNNDITVTIKVSTGQTYQATIGSNLEVGAVKEQLAGITGVPSAQQRLIYAGHVLKDNMTIASYNIKDGHTIHLVKGAAKTNASPSAAPAPAPAPASSAGGGAPAAAPFSPFGAGAGAAGGFGNFQAQLMQNPEMLQAMLDNPFVQNMMNDPETMRRMMMLNPSTRAMMEANPEIAQVMNNPQFMAQAMEMMRNPAMMQEMQRTNDRAMANLDAHPEGFNALRRLYQQVDEPMQNAAAEAAPAAADNPFASLFAQQQGAAPAPAAAGGPLPNPWGGGGGGGAAAAAPLGGLPAGGGAGLGNLFENPMVQQMTQQMLQNPQMMDNLLRAGPFGAVGGGVASDLVLDAATQVRYQQVQGNPEVIQAAAQLRLAVAAFRNAVNAAAPPAAVAPPAAAAAGANPFAGLFAAAAARPPPPAAAAGTGGAAGSGGAAAPVNLAARYQAELAQLNDMGFHDAEANLRALVATGGNVNAALELLLR